MTGALCAYSWAMYAKPGRRWPAPLSRALPFTAHSVSARDVGSPWGHFDKVGCAVTNVQAVLPGKHSWRWVESEQWDAVFLSGLRFRDGEREPKEF